MSTERFSRSLSEFRRYKLNERYGISLNEYFDLPFYLIRHIIETEREFLLEEKRVADDARREAEKELKKSGMSGLTA